MEFFLILVAIGVAVVAVLVANGRITGGMPPPMAKLEVQARRRAKAELERELAEETESQAEGPEPRAEGPEPPAEEPESQAPPSPGPDDDQAAQAEAPPAAHDDREVHSDTPRPADSNSDLGSTPHTDGSEQGPHPS